MNDAQWRDLGRVRLQELVIQQRYYYEREEILNVKRQLGLINEADQIESIIIQDKLDLIERLLGVYYRFTYVTITDEDVRKCYKTTSSQTTQTEDIGTQFETDSASSVDTTTTDGPYGEDPFREYFLPEPLTFTVELSQMPVLQWGPLYIEEIGDSSTDE